MSNEDLSDHKQLLEQLTSHVNILARYIGERNPEFYENLEKSRHYIESQLKKEKLRHSNHQYKINDQSFYNIVFETTGNNLKLPVVIIGAHYDSAPGTPGADDNATGVAALIELAKLLSKKSLEHTTRFVFFTLEEPPFFKTDNMGSFRYAKHIKSNREKVSYMLCLEMLGYFSDKKSQEYPIGIMKLFYPSKANFVGIVGTYGYSNVTKKFYNFFKKKHPLKSDILIAPTFLTGVDFSDHASFWKNDYPAFMITDTAFYRNENYHKPTDIPNTINFKVFATVTNSIFKTILLMDKEVR